MNSEFFWATIFIFMAFNKNCTLHQFGKSTNSFDLFHNIY